MCEKTPTEVGPYRIHDDRGRWVITRHGKILAFTLTGDLEALSDLCWVLNHAAQRKSPESPK